MTLYINAMNIHQGGGRALLLALLADLPASWPVMVLTDRRLAAPPSLASQVQYRAVAPTVMARLAAEWWLARTVGPDDQVLCLGNLPPLFPLKGPTAVFLQNRYLVTREPLAGFPLRARLRLRLERLWLATRSTTAQTFVVQTMSMKAACEASGIMAGRPILVRPFADGATRRPLPPGRPARDRPPTPDAAHFLYVASGEPHKNHRQLIEAWRLLAQDGLRPTLHLTVGDATPSLRDWIAIQRDRHGLNIHNHGQVTPDQVAELYRAATALVYPSMMESFGLPLIEARAAGLPILAAELDYVRDLIDPEESFDPTSALSIQRSVKRYLGCAEDRPPVLSPAQFIRGLVRPDRAGTGAAASPLASPGSAGQNDDSHSVSEQI